MSSDGGLDLLETCIFVMWVYFSSERFSSAENKRKIRDKRKIILLDYHKFLNLVCIFVFLCVSLNFYDAYVALHCQGVWRLSPGGQKSPWTYKFVQMGFVFSLFDLAPIRKVKSVLPWRVLTSKIIPHREDRYYLICLLSYLSSVYLESLMVGNISKPW